MHTRASLERFGAEAMIPAGLAIALIRETGPLVTAPARRRPRRRRHRRRARRDEGDRADRRARSGRRRFVQVSRVTRIVACMIAMPLLTTIMDFCGIFGGFLAETAITGMSWQLYFQPRLLADRVSPTSSRRR